MKKVFWTIIITIIVLGGLKLINTKTDWFTLEGKDIPTQEQIWMANPASTNCIEKGGKLEMRKNKNGEYGVCLFEDNRQCEERALLRGDCPVGGMKVTGYENDSEVYCAITGWEVEWLDTDTPMCKRVDGTLCNAQANLDGECPDPTDPNPNAGNIEAE